MKGYIGLSRDRALIMVHNEITPAIRNPDLNTTRGGDSITLDEAFAFCERMAKSHYENFPVASFLIPKEKRRYVLSIYAFARTADDLADEGNASADERLRSLDEWGEQLDKCYNGEATHPVFVALGETVRRWNIPKEPLSSLLIAFRMDTTRKRFETFTDLLYYCKHSANPVGQLVLYIFNNASDRTISLSNEICTALQLANFWQDVSVDWQKGRIYIPLEDMRRFGYTEQDLDRRVTDERFTKLMAFEVARTRELFEAGRPLLTEGVKDLHFELNLTWRGGMKILEKIERRNYDVLNGRPVLSFGNKLSILGSSLFRLT